MPPIQRIHRYVLIATVVAVNLFVAGLLTFALIDARDQRESEVRRDVENLGQLLDQSMTGAADRIDLSLRQICDELERMLKAGGHLESRGVNAVLEHHRSWLGDQTVFRVAGADGVVSYGPGVLPSAGASYGDRSFFITLRDHADAGLVVTDPIFGKVSKEWVIAFTRRYNDPGGAFAGVVSAAVPISYFSRLLSGLNVGPHGIALLRGIDTGVIAHQPPSTAPSAQIGAKGYSPELAAIIASGVKSQTFHPRQTADGVERINNYRRLTAVPFHQITGMGADDYLAEWRGNVRRAIGLAVLFLLASIVSMALLWRSVSLIERSRDRAAEAEQRLRFANAELVRLTEVMAHHFQEPARRLVTFAQRLKKGLEGQSLSEDSAHSLTFIEQQAGRLRGLVRDIQLYLAAGQPVPDPRPLPPTEVAERILAEKADALAEINAEVSVAPEMPPVRLDARRLSTILDVLIDNAIRYRRPGATLRIAISADRIGPMVRLRVADNGPGIAPEYRERVFRVFERLAQGAGDDSTGIGLAVVRRIVADGNGAVAIEETPGGGATVVIDLAGG